MTTEEKKRLGSAITRLSPEDINKALEIIAQNDPTFQAAGETVEVDIDAQVCKQHPIISPSSSLHVLLWLWMFLFAERSHVVEIEVFRQRHITVADEEFTERWREQWREQPKLQ